MGCVAAQLLLLGKPTSARQVKSDVLSYAIRIKKRGGIMRMLIRMDWQVNCTIRMRIGEKERELR